MLVIVLVLGFGLGFGLGFRLTACTISSAQKTSSLPPTWLG